MNVPGDRKFEVGPIGLQPSPPMTAPVPGSMTSMLMKLPGGLVAAVRRNHWASVSPGVAVDVNSSTSPAGEIDSPRTVSPSTKVAGTFSGAGLNGIVTTRYPPAKPNAPVQIGSLQENPANGRA